MKNKSTFKQAAHWVAKMFGYKADTKFGRMLWYILATCASIILLYIVINIAWGYYWDIYWKVQHKQWEKPTYCHDYWNHDLSPDVLYHEGNGDGYVYNKSIGRRTVTGLYWICKSENGDPWVCFSTGKKRGYFDINTGEVVIPALYEKAWVFSEDLACVMLDDKLGFINHEGEMVIENQFDYSPYIGNYCFHNGLCLMRSESGRMGMIDKLGAWAVDPIYTYIDRTTKGYWVVEDTCERKGLLDESGKTVLPCEFDAVYFDWQDENISVRTKDHIDQVFDVQGNLLNAFDYQEINGMEFPTAGYDDYGDQNYATAHCMMYRTSDYHCGLLDQSGKRLTAPLFTSITALGPDKYLCKGPAGSVILNDKGKEIGK